MCASSTLARSHPATPQRLLSRCKGMGRGSSIWLSTPLAPTSSRRAATTRPSACGIGTPVSLAALESFGSSSATCPTSAGCSGIASFQGSCLAAPGTPPSVFGTWSMAGACMLPMSITRTSTASLCTRRGPSFLLAAAAIPPCGSGSLRTSCGHCWCRPWCSPSASMSSWEAGQRRSWGTSWRLSKPTRPRHLCASTGRAAEISPPPSPPSSGTDQTIGSHRSTKRLSTSSSTGKALRTCGASWRSSATSPRPAGIIPGLAYSTSRNSSSARQRRRYSWPRHVRPLA
mmetsp:Transcript_53260/g.114419  ORF Transcript_53260/g.114419 Transcript_53260/m.114419 type:complete len:287 (+) Transcript_53260:1215-2075(+)